MSLSACDFEFNYAIVYDYYILDIDMSSTPNLNRLRLACRRGMWELDLLLESFLEHGYFSLNDQEKFQFECLLECDDPDLFSWFMGERKPENLAFLNLIEKIKDNAKEI